MIVVALHHSEQVIRRRLLMGQDEDTQALAVCGLVVIPGADISADAELAALQHQSPYLAGALSLGLQPLVKVLLRPVEVELAGLAFLGPDSQAFGGVMQKVVFEALAD